MRFSVVIPTYDRPEPLRRCLEGFTRLDHSSWELLVVNDGGATSFGSIDDTLRARLPLTTIDAPHRGPAAARNCGARAARGEFLAFTDDDCIPEPDWLRQLERGFAQENAAVLGGAAINPFPESVPAVTWELYLDFLREYFQDASGNGLMLPSNNLAYRREAFWSLGGFDETFPLAAAEDVDLAYRAVAAGLRQRYFDDARVWHYHRSTPRGYLRQQFRYGRGSFDLRRRKYAVQAIPRRPGEFYWRLARFLRRRRAPAGVWALVWMTPFAHRAGIISQSLRYRRTVADS
jgi:GT2 family glycosyltransferase